MRRLLCETLGELIDIVREHVADDHGEYLKLADDVEAKHFGFLCDRCQAWWSAPVVTRFQASSEVRSIFESLKSRNDFLQAAVQRRQEARTLERALYHVAEQDVRIAAELREQRNAQLVAQVPPPKPKKPPSNVFEHLMDENDVTSPKKSRR